MQLTWCKVQRAPPREPQPQLEGVGSSWNKGLLLLAHAAKGPYLTVCSQKDTSIKLLFLHFCCSCWDLASHWVPFCHAAAWSAFLLPRAICLPAL